MSRSIVKSLTLLGVHCVTFPVNSVILFINASHELLHIIYFHKISHHQLSQGVRSQLKCITMETNMETTGRWHGAQGLLKDLTLQVSLPIKVFVT